MRNISGTVSAIWSIADTLRGRYPESDFARVILPLTILRRLDQVMAGGREAVWAADDACVPPLKAASKQEQLLVEAAGQTFYNTSTLSFDDLVTDRAEVALTIYMSGFSRNVQDILARFDFDIQVERLDRADLLLAVLRRFREIDLSPDHLDDADMGDVFEALIRRFAEQSGEDAGVNFTPREVVRLMVNLLFAGDTDALGKSEGAPSIYDPACGTGGMLSVAEDFLMELSSQARPELFGQELIDEYYAICKANMLLRGENAENIKYGNTLVDDALRQLRADYVISNPPFGVGWSKIEDSVRKEHEEQGFDGRFGPGLPQTRDAALLFLLHMISKWKPVAQGGSRMVVVLNGGPLFLGGPGTGESEIRRWIIENDWLESVIVMPEQIFYNTGISTYICVLTNRKASHRKGKVQLVDAGDYLHVLKNSVGRKRNELGEDNIDDLMTTYASFTPSADVRIADNASFGFRTLTIDCPLRLNFQASEERIARLVEERAWQTLGKTGQRGGAGPADMPSQTQLQIDVVGVLRSLDHSVLYQSRTEFERALGRQAEANRVSLPPAIQKIVLSALSLQDQHAAICISDGKPEPDPELRRHEEIAADTEVETYLNRFVRGHHPGAWGTTSAVGFKVHRVAHLGFKLEGALERLGQQYKSCELVPMGRVCQILPRRSERLPGVAGEAIPDPLRDIVALRHLAVSPNTNAVSADYLAMFFATDLGQRLLRDLSRGTTIPRVTTADLAQLLVPVPTLEQQLSLLQTKRRIEELSEVLAKINSELAANPENLVAVNQTVAPMLQVLGRVTEVDRIRELVRGGESKRVEYKETFSLDVRKRTKEPYIEESALKTIVAFLNSDGGDLLVGVADDGRIAGLAGEISMFHKSSIDEFLQFVRNRLKTRIGEQFYPLIDQKVVEVDRAKILWVHCVASKSPAYLDEESFFVRTNPATDKLTGRKVHEYIKTRFGI
jgi:type I restriction enzyme M protein